MKRRKFLMTTGMMTGALPVAAAPLLQAPARVGSRPAIKITDIKTYLAGVGGRNLLFVKVETDEGIHGIGEAYSCGPDEGTVAVINDFKRWLVGQDPRNIEHLWSTMMNFTRFPGGLVVNAAISGIEHALWDIAGKAAGLPVYMLLGGKCREKIRVYQSAGGDSPARVAESAKALVEKYGYTAVKMSPHQPKTNEMPYNAVTRFAGQRVGAVREALGPDVDIGVDIHAKFFEVSRAIRLAREIEPHRPFWLEEPIRPENVDAMAKLAAHVNIPLASGECNYTKYEFQRILHVQALDIVQPDVCVCGGLMEMKKIAALAEAHYVMVAPHNPMGPVATTVNVHFAASTPNFLILEYHPDDSAPRKDLLKEPLMVKDGYIPLPNKPGLGIELNEEAFRHYPPKPWRRGFAYRADGSVDFI
ncbi:MAG: galactonate dehydratase [Acidobacteria bacterium]|nr:galactonate dehydratase [Acidobacteriota bacterium]MCI0620216.1 galactonate dehydratase [Acidobacteriota bacterium]MCI0722854.1 galactonate dehydratase [Acidobacteriota bacterium]